MSKKLTILIVHNKYLQYGGEDSVVAEEVEMLRENGHSVYTYMRDNREIAKISKISLFFQTIWSRKTTKDIKKIIIEAKPDVIHAHNTFPLISPSLVWIAMKLKVPVVMTIHNFRLSCLQAMFLRQNKICEDCKGRIPWKGVVKKCYRNSYLESFALATMLFIHKILGTYSKKVSAYVALNKFCKSKLEEIGLPSRLIHVKPNFIDSKNPLSIQKDGNPLFVGRLSNEKGIKVLSEAITKIPEQMFDVVGDGPLRSILEDKPNVNLLGSLSQEDVIHLMSNAQYLIMPSIWYENMPRTLVESFSCGTPVIASDIGALKCLIRNKETGLLFEAGSCDSLCEAISWAKDNNVELMAMGRKAYREYKEYYTSKINHQILMDIYMKIIT